jgi:predicted nucleotidyltransferase
MVSMNNLNIYRQMIKNVADALGTELCQQMVFVGGCTTGLLITDDFTKEQVRHTDDVDLIVSVINHRAYIAVQEQLRTKGFKEDMSNDDPICTMRLGGLRVDFMPDDESVLGSGGNVWFKEAWKTAENYQLTDDTKIRLVLPVYFVATKLQAYLGRGNNDPLASHDIEDLLNIFDGREEIISEIMQAEPALRQFIVEEIRLLLKAKDFDYAVQNAAQNDSEREALIFERLEQIVEFTS